jgi:hypothetical protein
MKRTTYLLLSVLYAITFTNYSYAKAEQQFSGINQVTFKDEKHNKAFVGNGFLITHKNKLFAVTVKHALLEAKTPTLTSVYLRDEMQEWRIHPNKNPQEFIILGRLLNANKNETIDMKVLSKDWLVFEVKENNSNLSVLRLRDSELEFGEILTAYGCSYANKETCSQDEYQGKFMSLEKNNLRVSMPDLDLSKLRGLSGSPVLDKNNRVVGIVSNILKSKSGEGFDFAPASLDYLREVLTKLVK